MVECFSRLESVRCRDLLDTQHIVIYLPSGLSLLLVPVLLALTWKHPKATIILLAIELLLSGTVDTWNLVTQLVPPTPDTFRSQDIALGVISSLPILSLLLFTTSFLVSDLRPCLPHILQSNKAVLIFASIVLPLVPTAFVATLLGNVLFIVYFVVGQRIRLGFERTFLRNLHDTLNVVSLVTATTFILLILTCAILTLSKPSSRTKWREDFQSIPALVLLSFGLLLAGLDIVLGLTQESFAVILTRRILKTASRVLLTIGLVGSYYPSGRKNGTGIPLPLSPRRTRGQKKEPQRPARPAIGPPVVGSFHHMSRSATRSFHDAHSRRDGTSAQRGGRSSKGRDPASYDGYPSRPPKLSITPSTFDQPDLATMANAVRDREGLIQKSIAMNEEFAGGDNPFLSPEEQRDRYLQIKRNTSTPYRPTLIPLHEACGSQVRDIDDHELEMADKLTRSQWPLPPDFDPRQGLASWTDTRNEESRSTSPEHRLGQVSAYRTADRLHATPIRTNSARRKPVPSYGEDLDVPGDRSVAGHLSFISTSTSPAPVIGRSSPALPSPASNHISEEVSPTSNAKAGPSGRNQRRRDTDPANAVVPRSPNDSSIYSDSMNSAEDRALFFRPPIHSPSSSTPAKSTTVSPRVSLVPPSRPSSSNDWRDNRPDMTMALSSLARVRRDTGVDLDPQSAVSTGGSMEAKESSRIDRSSTTTWSSDDLTPRASERGWWTGNRVDT